MGYKAHPRKCEARKVRRLQGTECVTGFQCQQQASHGLAHNIPNGYQQLEVSWTQVRFDRM
jgi:hypothetical protein